MLFFTRWNPPGWSCYVVHIWEQVFVQAMYLHMIIHFVVVYEAKRTENSREREEKASETEGDDEQEMYTVCDKSICSLCCFIIYVLLSTIIDTYCGNWNFLALLSRGHTWASVKESKGYPPQKNFWLRFPPSGGVLFGKIFPPFAKF